MNSHSMYTFRAVLPVVFGLMSCPHVTGQEPPKRVDQKTWTQRTLQSGPTLETEGKDIQVYENETTLPEPVDADSRFLTLGSAAFVPIRTTRYHIPEEWRDDEPDYDRRYEGYVWQETGWIAPVYMTNQENVRKPAAAMAPVQLPDGTHIRSVSIVYTDPDPYADISVTLIRSQIVPIIGAENEVVRLKSHGSAGKGVTTIRDIEYPTIHNAIRQYYILAVVPVGHWVGEYPGYSTVVYGSEELESAKRCRLYAVRIEYTLPE